VCDFVVFVPIWGTGALNFLVEQQAAKAASLHHAKSILIFSGFS
jgi:hypothetical protein